jgi:hypothetical protein
LDTMLQPEGHDLSGRAMTLRRGAAAIVLGASVITVAMSLPPPAHADDLVRASTHNREVRADTHRDAGAKDNPADDIWADRETWAGAEHVGGGLSVYSGATRAIGGGPLNEAGWRIRSVSGHGRSSFAGVAWIGGHAVPAAVQARTGFSDLLAGYQWGETTGFGQLTVKVFAGGSVEYRKASPLQAVAERGFKTGGKAAVESWLDLSDRSWLSADVSVGSANRMVAGRTRSGWRIIPGVSLGPELGGNRSNSRTDIRGGAFARLEWGAGDWWSGELSASGGLAGQLTTSGIGSAGGGASSQVGPYSTVNLLLRY